MTVQHVRSLGAAEVVIQSILEGQEVRQVGAVLDIQQRDEELVPDCSLHVPGRYVHTLKWTKHGKILLQFVGKVTGDFRDYSLYMQMT